MSTLASLLLLFAFVASGVSVVFAINYKSKKALLIALLFLLVAIASFVVKLNLGYSR